jgi:hypothetical protein
MKKKYHAVISDQTSKKIETLYNIDGHSLEALEEYVDILSSKEARRFAKRHICSDYYEWRNNQWTFLKSSLVVIV